MGSHQGRKYSSSHTTAIEGARPLLAQAEKMVAVSKISLGYIRKVRAAPGSRSLKIVEEPAGLLLNVRVGSSLQEIRIYTSLRSEVSDVLRKAFDK